MTTPSSYLETPNRERPNLVEASLAAPSKEIEGKAKLINGLALLLLDPNTGIENIKAFFELYALSKEELKQKTLKILEWQYPGYEFEFTQDLKLQATLQSKEDVKVMPELPSQVENLILSHCADLNLTAHSSLTNLKSLIIWGGAISDISALSKLINLEKLTMHNVRNLTDISALSSLTNLESLEISNCPVSDISAVSNLTSLKILEIWDYPVIDLNLTALSSLTNLTRLSVGSSPNLSDISALSSLTNLEELMLYNLPNLSNLTAHSSLKNLKSLTIDGCPNLNAASKKLIQELQNNQTSINLD